jgi:2-oxoisovalerate dehydrogenase E1 component beta subunit
LHDAIWQEMERDERVVVLGEDVGQRGGVFLATDGLFERFGAERVIDTPLAEGAIVGVAIGAAVAGLRPVAEIQFADFIYPAVDQIVSEAAKLRYRSRGGFSCPLVIRAPFGGGVHGGLHHSQCPENMFAQVPGLRVVAPATPYDMAGLFRAAVRDPDPVLFFEHKRCYRSIRGEVPDDDYVVPIGRAEVKRAGRDLSIFCYGYMLHEALAAAEAAAGEGIEAEVVDLRSLAPLDQETILDSVARTSKALVVYEANLTGGIGGEVAALIAEHAFESLDGPVVRIATPDIPALPYVDSWEEFVLPNAAKILDGIRRLAAF